MTGSTRHLIDTGSQSLSQVLSGSVCYRVPRFQRDYSWTKSEWEDLLADINDVVATEDSHFLGHIVLCPAGRDLTEIIDGQQRLTTVLLVTLAAAIKFNQAVGKGVDREVNSERVNICLDRLQTRDMASSKRNPRIKLSHRNSEYFNKLVSDLTITEPETFLITNKKIHSSLKFFTSKFKEMDCDKVADLLKDMYDLIFASVISVSSMISAFAVFESLNHKGTRLQVADLVKNLIMSKLIPDNVARSDSEEYMEIIDSDWDEVLSKVTEAEISNYLRSLELLHSEGKIVNMKKLYDHVDKRIVNQKEAEKYLKEISEHASAYRAIRGMSKKSWIHKDKDFSKTLPVMEVLRLFDVRLPISLLLAAADVYGEVDFLKLANAIVAVTIRFNVIGNNPSRDMETHYAELIPRVISKKITVVDIIESFKSSGFYPDDSSFSSKFKSYRVKQTDKVAYILGAIEEVSPTVTRDDLVAGKIAFQDSGKYWEGNLGSDILEEIKDGVANYYLATGEGNAQSIQNFEQYKSLHSDSQFNINKRIAEYDEWSEANYKAHQESLANAAANIWELPDAS